MKKIIFLFFLLLIISGCSNDVSEDVDSGDINIDDIDNEINDIDKIIDGNEINDIERDLNSI